jgi:hypothetical protein
MQNKPAALIASQPAALSVLEPMVQDLVEVFPANTIHQALMVLEREPQRILLIVCTIAFDDSRLFDFLQLIKTSDRTRHIPFIGCRVLASVLPDNLVNGLSQSCKFLGASDFVDIANVEKQFAVHVMRNLVIKHTQQDKPAAT